MAPPPAINLVKLIHFERGFLLPVD